jgi:DNA polymerase-3 subunit alpha
MLLLDVRTHFSLGESVVTIPELVKYAKEKGFTAVAMCDTMNISGMIDFTKRCKEEGIKPVVGCRLRIVDDPTHRKVKGEPKSTNREFYLKVWIRNDAGWRAVMRLLSKGLSDAYFYYKPRIGLDDLIEELLPGTDLMVTTGDFQSVMTHPDWANILTRLKAAAHDSLLGEIIPLDTPFWDRQNAEVLKALGERQVVATLPTLYLDKDDADARDVAGAIMSNQKVSEPWCLKPATRCHVPMGGAELDLELGKLAQRLSSHYGVKVDPLALRTGAMGGQIALVAACDYTWEKLPVSLPNIAVGETEFEMVVRLCKEGARHRFTQLMLGHKPGPADLPEYTKRLQYELSVIRKMGFERYFLVVADLVRWAKENGIIVGPGRGSVGGSLVAYLMGITDVDPIRFNLLFERFINPERIDLPDADLDFQSSRREEVIEYLVRKYGREYVAAISNFTTMASGSALRDTGRVLEIDLKEMEVTKLVPKEHGKPKELAVAAEEVPQIEAFKDKFPKVWNIATRLEGVMRSFGRHAAGIVVGGEPISSRAVVETHRGEPVVNWDKVFVEDLGLVKMDILGLSTLDVLQLALKYIERRHSIVLDLRTLSLDDEPTMQAFSRGDTIGVFQFESSGMRKLLKDLGAAALLTFEDLAAATSLYRPGPKDSGLLDDYVAIKQGLKRPYYEHPRMQPALEATLGVMIYQEQVMQIMRDLCGFTGAEADNARKAMGKKDKEKMEKLRVKFVDGAKSHSGMDERAANGLFDKIMNFAAYGFNRSHAVEYSVISYWTMYLKVHYGPEFFAAGLSVLGEEKLEGLVRDARKRSIEVMPPLINSSSQKFEIVSDAMRDNKVLLITPFNRVKGISEGTGAAIIEARKKAGGKFTSRAHMESLVEKRKVNSAVREKLELVGAFAGIDRNSKAPLHPDRRKDQMTLMPGLIIDSVRSDRTIEAGDIIKSFLIDEIVKPMATCKNCSLAGGVHPVPRLGKKPRFMVVTDCPNYSEEQANKMLEGKASGFLRSALLSAGLHPADGYFTSLVKSPKGTGTKMLSNEQVNGCTAFLKREIEILKPPLIVALGSATLNFLIPGLKGGTTDHVGRVIYDAKLDCNIVVGFNPAQIAYSPEKQAQLNEILATVAELTE